MWREAQRGPNDLRLIKAKERQRECRFARPGPADYRRLHATRLSFHAYAAMRAIVLRVSDASAHHAGKEMAAKLFRKDSPTRNHARPSLHNRVA